VQNKFLEVLNIRIIAFHFLGTVLLLLAIRQFSFFLNTGLLKMVEQYGNEISWKAGLSLSQKDMVLKYLSMVHQAGFFGVLLGGLLSAYICWRNFVHTNNAMVVIVLGYIVYRFDLLALSDIQTLLLYPGIMAGTNGLASTLLINGIYLLGFSILIFFSKLTKRFI
jgi:hypothetical protein